MKFIKKLLVAMASAAACMFFLGVVVALCILLGYLLVKAVMFFGVGWVVGFFVFCGFTVHCYSDPIEL